MAKMPTPEERQKMHELAKAAAEKTLDPVAIIEGLLNDAPELSDLKNRLIEDGIVEVVNDDGSPIR